jgi:putative aldouronate transport system permease protein
MMLPALLLVFVYSYVPMAGIVIAFQRFIPAKGLFGKQQWIGLGNFQFVLSLPDTYRVLRNTVLIAFLKIVANMVVPITVSLLLNEIASRRLKRTVQTLVYLPHFLSWVILGGVLIDILSPSQGILNQFLALFGVKPIFFLGDVRWFPYVIVISDVWKNFGFNTIVYLAAITGIGPELYEAAWLDGAGRLK